MSDNITDHTDNHDTIDDIMDNIMNDVTGDDEYHQEESGDVDGTETSNSSSEELISSGESASRRQPRAPREPRRNTTSPSSRPRPRPQQRPVTSKPPETESSSSNKEGHTNTEPNVNIDDNADTTVDSNKEQSAQQSSTPRRSRPRRRPVSSAPPQPRRSRPRLHRPGDSTQTRAEESAEPEKNAETKSSDSEAGGDLNDAAEPKQSVSAERTSSPAPTRRRPPNRPRTRPRRNISSPSSSPRTVAPEEETVNEDDTIARGKGDGSVVEEPRRQGVSDSFNPLLDDKDDGEDNTVATDSNDDTDNSVAEDLVESSPVDDGLVEVSPVDDEFEEQFSSFFEDDDEMTESDISVSPASVSGESLKGSGGSRRHGFDKEAIISKYAPLSEKRTQDTAPQKSRYRHHTEQGTVTARQIQFYRNLNLALTYDQHKVADLLSVPTDKQETPEEKARRERMITQAIGGEEALRRGSKLRISDKDIEALRFLAAFKFANARNVAKMFSENEDTTRKRLNRLRDRGLVLSNKLYGLSTVYFLSEEGMVLSGYSYKTIKKSEINPASFPHTAGVTHLAACLIGADVDVLGFRDYDNSDWPTRNRLVFDETTRNFVRDFGEMISSEFEIQTWLGRRKGNTKGEIYKPKAQADISFALREWNKKLDELKDATRASKTEEERKERLNDILLHANRSPEMIYENEWMWALFPRNPANLIHHVPDLVVKRPRDTKDGSPRSIAVELELTAKNDDSSYVKTLTAYKNDKDMYAKVIWISPTRSIRNKLQKIADQVGLSDTGKFRVMPLYYEHGEWPVSEHLGKI